MGLVGAAAAAALRCFYSGGTDRDRAGLEVVRTAGTLVVGTGGATALLLAASTSCGQEISIHSPRSRSTAGIVMHSTFANGNGTKAVCLWQAETVDEVRDLVDSALGQFSRNEFFEVSKETAIGLPD